MFGFDFGGMDAEAAAHLEIVGLLALGAIAVVAAAIVSGACRGGGGAFARATRSAQVVDDDDVERALGDATQMTYGQAAAAAAAAKKKASPSPAAGAGAGVEGEEIDTCVVCLSEYAGDGEPVRVVPACGHFFHAECVDAWLRKKRRCPTCRGGLSPLPPLPKPECAPLPPRTSRAAVAAVDAAAVVD